MKPKLYHLLPIGIIFLVFSCKTASKAYERGNYDQAVDLAAKKLQKDPNDPKLIDVLQNSYRFAVEDHESKIRNHAASNNELKWEHTYQEYVALQRLYESIRRSPNAYKQINPVDYSSYVTTYREKAGMARYDRGLVLLAGNDKQSSRRAYQEFQAAAGYLPDDLQVRQKMQEAYELAVVNIVVLPLDEGSSYRYSSFNSRYRGFDNNILRYLQKKQQQ